MSQIKSGFQLYLELTFLNPIVDTFLLLPRKSIQLYLQDKIIIIIFSSNSPSIDDYQVPSTNANSSGCIISAANIIVMDSVILSPNTILSIFQRYSQSYLQSNSQPFFFISALSSPRIFSQSGAVANLISSKQFMMTANTSGSPFNSSSLLLLLRDRSSSFAPIILLELIFIQGSYPFTKNINEYIRLYKSSLRHRTSLELAARLLKRSEPLNLSRNSSGMCLPFLTQGTLSSKSVKQILCFILALPTMKLLGLMSPWIIQFLCRYSIRSTNCKPTMSTVFKVNLPPHFCLRFSRFSPNSSMTRYVLPFSSNASLIQGNP